MHKALTKSRRQAESVTPNAALDRAIGEAVGDDPFFHWTSTQAAAGTAYQRTTYLGTQFAEAKTSATATQVRAIRRIQVLP
jgi:hypothetical protein